MCWRLIQPTIPFSGGTATLQTANRHSGIREYISWQPPTDSISPHKAGCWYGMEWCTGNVNTASGYLTDSGAVDHRWLTVAYVFDNGTMKVFQNCTLQGNWDNNYPPVNDLC